MLPPQVDQRIQGYKIDNSRQPKRKELCWLSSFAAFTRKGELHGFILFDSAGVIQFIVAPQYAILVQADMRLGY